jgi:hypothetical protein
VTDFDSHPESRVRNSQPAGIGRVADLGDLCAWNNLGRNVVFATPAFETCAIFDQTQFPDDDEPSQYDLDVHAILDVPTAGVVVVLNHLGTLRAFRRSEVGTPGVPRSIDPVWTTSFAADVERVVLVGDRLVGSRPREEEAAGVLVSEPIRATGGHSRLDTRVELESWVVVTALGTVRTEGRDSLAVGGGGRVALVPIDGGSVSRPQWDVAVDFEPAGLVWDGQLLWATGPEHGAAAVGDYDWEALRGGGFAALDPSDGNAVVRGRFTHDLAWGNGGNAVVILAGLVCGVGRNGELDVYRARDGSHLTRTAPFASASLGIAHAAVVGDRVLYGFNRGGYRLHAVAASTITREPRAPARRA